MIEDRRVVLLDVDKETHDEFVLRYSKVFKDFRKRLRAEGYINAVLLSRMPDIGRYASDLKKLAKKNKIDAIRAHMNGTVKWWYKEEEALKFMQEMKEDDDTYEK